MSDEFNQSFSIEFLLRQVDQALAAKDIEAAEKLLADVKGRAQPGAPEYAAVQRQERDLQAVRNERVTALEGTIHRLLTQMPMLCDDLEKEIDQLQRLAPSHSSLDAWRNALGRERQKQRIELQVQEMESELNRRWQKAEESERAGVYGVTLVDLYESALKYAEQRAGDLETPLALKLRQQAELRWKEVRARQGLVATRQQTGEFKLLLDELDQMQADARVLITRNEGTPLQFQELIPVAEARTIIMRQARDYAGQKASQYRDKAREHLEQHSPKAAEDELRKAAELFALDEEERQKNLLLLTAHIQPALEARRVAVSKLRDADRQGDPQRAWELYMEARNADPFAPELENVHKAVVSRIKGYLDERLQEARNWLLGGEASDFDSAFRIATEARKWAGQDVEFKVQMALAEALITEAEFWKRLDGEIKTAISDAEAKKEAQPDVAYEGLQARMAGWGERAQRFKALRDTLAALEARVNVNALIARATQALRETSLEGVKEPLRACDVAIKENQPRQSEVIAMRRRLDLHLKYLQGATLLRNPARTSADEQSGLKLLQEVIDGKGDDLNEARELANTVKRDRKAEEEAASALGLGNRRLQEKRYEEAYAALKPYATRDEFAELLEQAAVAWEAQLLREVQDALAASRIDETQVTKWVMALERLGSERAGELRARVIGKSRAQEARDLEGLPNKRWGDILSLWDKALAADPTNVEHQSARQNADKQNTYFEVDNALSLEVQIAQLDALVERYPADLEVRLRLIDKLVKHISALRNLEEIERNVMRAQGLIAQVEGMVSRSDDARKLQAQLAEQAKTVQTAREIAQRKNDIEQQLQADRPLDSWKRARMQIDELLRDYPARSDLMVWSRAIHSETLRGAQERLKEKTTTGADVWDRVQPAAQVLILDKDNVEARQQIEGAYQAVAVLESKLTTLEGDKVGAAYSGEGRQTQSNQLLVNQLADVNALRRKLMVAEQALMLFGGFVQDPEALRNQVNRLQARNSLLVEQLEQLQRYLAGMHAAILSARSDESEHAWYPVDEQRSLIDRLGYGRHRAVLAMDEAKRQVQEKQKHLRDLRGRITQAVQAGNTSEALRLAEQMRRSGDPLADPNDEFAEQSRFRVQEPYTRRTLTHLDDVVALLAAQKQQVEQLREWLPMAPEAGSGGLQAAPPRVNQRLVRWGQVAPAVDEAMHKGTFDAARKLIDEALNGEQGENGRPSGKLGGALALNAAIDWLSQPIIAEPDLKSAEAKRLWDSGRQLFRELQADRDTALTRRVDVDRLENEWQDAWGRLIGAVGVVDFELSRPWFEKLRPSWKAELVRLKQTARVEYNACVNLCPAHPDLEGYESNPLLG